MPSYTPKIKTDSSICSLEKIKLGGLNHSVLIRGTDRSNPILLFLHGGPGMPLMYMAHSFRDSLEKEFIVVHYDRRGAGKSYNKRIDPETISDQQYYEDALELTHILRQKFNREKIFIVGHSWGTYLGSILAYKNPDLFHAYISVGQVVNYQKARALQHDFIVKKANERNRPEAVEDLKNYGYGVYEKWLFKFGAQLHSDTSYKVFVKEGMRSPEYSLFDALKIGKGSEFSQNHIQYKIIPSAILEDSIYSYDIPCYFIVGEFDMTTPTPLIEEYFNKINCPDKELIVFQNSAHFPFYEEKELFFTQMRRIKNLTMDHAYGNSLNPHLDSISAKEDFDFYIGKWKVKNERILDEDTRQFFTAQVVVHKTLNGYGNVDYFVTTIDGKPFEGITFRQFDNKTNLWHIRWYDSDDPMAEPKPSIGKFEYGTGSFYKSITLRTPGWYLSVFIGMTLKKTLLSGNPHGLLTASIGRPPGKCNSKEFVDSII